MSHPLARRLARPLGLLLATVAGLGLAALVLRAAPATPEVPALRLAPRAAQPSSSWAWRPGLTYRYALEVRLSQRLRRALGGDQRLEVEGQLDLAGRLSLHVAQALPGGGWRVGLELDQLQRHHLALMGQQADPRVAEGHVAWLDLDPSGRVGALRFAPATPDLARHLLQGLAGQLEWILQPGPTWSARSETPFAEAADQYQRAGEAVSRRRRFTALRALPEARPVGEGEGQAEIVDGVLHRLSLRETVRGEAPGGEAEAETALSLALQATAPVGLRPGPELEALEARALAQVTGSAAAEDRALEARVDGLTGDALLAVLLRFGASGRLPDHNRWLWRATGLLLQQPGLSATLEAVFAEPALGARGRALVADLLAGAGHAPAQASLRRILEGPAAADPDRGLLLQRLSQVTAPTEDTLAWLGSEQAEGADPLPAAFALGAALERADAPAQAQALLGQLIEATHAAEPETRGHLLRALGNTGRPEAAAVARDYAADPDPAVRAGAAVALRISREPRGQQTLVALAGDPRFTVAGAALDSLLDLADGGQLTAEAHAALAAAAADGRLHPQGQERIARLVAPALR